jgi:hypothetical protein
VAVRSIQRRGIWRDVLCHSLRALVGDKSMALTDPRILANKKRRLRYRLITIVTVVSLRFIAKML